MWINVIAVWVAVFPPMFYKIAGILIIINLLTC